MPGLPRSSLVGLPAPETPPGRGDAGGSPAPTAEGRGDGPIEARKLGERPWALPPGPGEGLGLGGWRLAMSTTEKI